MQATVNQFDVEIVSIFWTDNLFATDQEREREGGRGRKRNIFEAVFGMKE
jgi:hypothetical protein